jgi:hypothetical protein
MAAGLGFKTFTTGEVLSAGDVNGYLMQGVLVFASAAARDAAITSPQEGQFAYLKDTNVTTYYTGSAWTNLDTTGMVNPMTTTGDTIYSSSGSTPARLGIGSSGQVLTVAGGVPTWATAGGGGKVLQVVQGISTTQVANSSTTYLSTGVTATITPSSASSKVMVFASLPIAPNVTLITDATIFRGTTSGTNLAASALAGLYGDVGTMNMQFLDSPSTTSAQVYTVATKQPSAGGGTSYAPLSGYTGVITLMEIGA